MNYFSSIISLDNQIQNAIPHFRNETLNDFFLTFTKLGNWGVILGLTIFISILFFINKKRNLILPLFVSVLGSGILALVIKYLVDRVRPDTNLAVYLEHGPSFPSAHAALTTAFFGFFIYVIWRFSTNLNKTAKIISTIVFGLVIILIGFSRIYLGVHFLSDVIIGYLVGFFSVLVGIYVSKKSLSL